MRKDCYTIKYYVALNSNQIIIIQTNKNTCIVQPKTNWQLSFWLEDVRRLYRMRQKKRYGSVNCQGLKLIGWSSHVLLFHVPVCLQTVWSCRIHKISQISSNTSSNSQNPKQFISTRRTTGDEGYPVIIESMPQTTSYCQITRQRPVTIRIIQWLICSHPNPDHSHTALPRKGRHRWFPPYP